MDTSQRISEPRHKEKLELLFSSITHLQTDEFM